ncbi:hypothetical protein HMPREF0063_11784 [Aeromicrobium marinum DSM 15272]|uniref:Uncharacterized protein n=1 Tax=Aeromicrobium marinum DSM 15272 TaxID=585531 RepID=E2SDJ8_9ACTN|nr:hypothetical protein [Aeromicrobium marinum]EFQ82575.1 hypothetical protein HMPREF0063_11784 [Aeromicrobium marinum DSM 15272]
MVGGASGLIFAFVVILWVAYVVPVVLRRYDEASKTSTLGSLGSLSRVIPHPGRAVAEPAVVAEPVRPTSLDPSAAPAARTLDRPAARLAARRRRRVLITLVTTLVVTAVAAVAGYVAGSWVAAPAALIVAWLVACRIQVRGERGIGSRRAREASPVSTSADEEQTVVLSGQFEDVDPGRRHEMETVALEADALEERLTIAVPSVSSTGEALWDPLPVTLPTYVTKPRAGRTVRSIDFGQPGTWTSGHVEGEDTELPGRRDDDGHGEQRAVGH